MKTFYLTTPLYYPNARPHVGSAYTTIVCDVIARYKRMYGGDVAFLTGTDEHGEKLERAAAAAGKSPGEFVAEKRKLFVDLWKKLGINYDYFVYTDQPDHVASVQRIMRLAKTRNPEVIYKKTYQGRYCVSDERYISDGIAPVNCDVCGRPAELITEENYFFKLSAFGGEDGRLMKLYKEHPEFVQPDYRRNEVLSFVRSGLRDISVSRKRIKWGIPWPDDSEQVFYVWYDALTGYLTGIGYAEGEQGNATFQRYWRNDAQGEVVHMIGKDILRFHAVYWPAFLMAAGLPLPKTIFAHGWIYYEQDKMSKSKGNVVYPEPIIDALDSFGAPGNDALRYYLLRDTPFGLDGNFSYEGLIDRYNFDLANDLGNLASRTITMIRRFPGGKVPPPHQDVKSERVNSLENSLKKLLVDYRGYVGEYDLYRALAGVSGVVSDLNGLLNHFKPWSNVALINRSPSVQPGRTERLPGEEPHTIQPSPAGQQLADKALYVTADVLRCIAVLLAPFIPESAQRLWEKLGCPGKVGDQRLDKLEWGQLEPGISVGSPEPIFPRLDKEKTLAKLHEFAASDYDRDKPKEASITVGNETGNTPGTEPVGSTGVPPVQEDMAKARPEPREGMAVPLQPSTAPPTPAPAIGAPPPLPASALPQITIEDFAKVEMCVGEIISAESIPKATKLLKVMVDIGTEVRQVCAGIAEFYKPEDLVGMKVVLVTNLQPRKLRGVESNGMIVAASVGEGGRPVLVTFKEDVPKGAKLK